MSRVDLATMADLLSVAGVDQPYVDSHLGGKTLTAPTAGEDGKVPVWNQGANSWGYLTPLTAASLTAHTSRTDNPHDVTKAQVGLGNADNTSDANKPVSTATATALGNKADLVGGKVPTAQLPALATNETVTVASQAAMLASGLQEGDIAIRSDQAGRRWLLGGTDPTVLANWIQLEVPDAVSSVNGQAGAVVLAPADVGAQPVDADLTSIAALATTAYGRSFLTQADAAAARTLTGAAPLADPTFTGTATAPAATLTNAGKTALALTNAGANTGLTIGADTTLYRRAAGTLTTDGTLEMNNIFATTFINANRPAGVLGANSVVLGYDGAAAAPAIAFGVTFDTNLYRSAANTLKTDDSFVVGGATATLPSGTRVGTGADVNSFTAAFTALRSNYTSATDRSVDTALPSWSTMNDGRAGQDRWAVQRAPATGVAPVWADRLSVSSTSTQALGPMTIETSGGLTASLSLAASTNTVNGVSSRLLVASSLTDDDQNIVTLKRQTSTWGMTSAYGKGQAVAFLKDSIATTDIGYTGTTVSVASNAGDSTLSVASSAAFVVGDGVQVDTGGNLDQMVVQSVAAGSITFTSPLAHAHAAGATVSLLGNYVLSRMDNRGGLGIQGMHIAVGLRQEAGWTGPYAVRMTPYIDTPILQMYPQLGTTLAVAIPDGVSTAAITVGSTSAYPAAGTIALINAATGAVTEKIAYTGKTQTTLTGITRGVGGTAGVAHAITEVIQLVQTSNYLQGWTPGAYQETFRITPTGTGVFGQGPVGANAGDGMAIGDVGTGSAGYFGAAHSDRMNGTDYALMQGQTGDTYLNAAATKSVNMRIANRALFLMAQTSDAVASVTNPTQFNFGLGYLQAIEINDPGVPGVNTGRLYFRDNGAGKTQLMVQFNTGTPIQLAIQV